MVLKSTLYVLISQAQSRKTCIHMASLETCVSENCVSISCWNYECCLTVFQALVIPHEPKIRMRLRTESFILVEIFDWLAESEYYQHFITRR